MEAKKILGVLVVAIMLQACAQDSPPQSGQTSEPAEQFTEAALEGAYAPYARRTFPTRVFFGDTHLHTRLSLDAYADGNTTNGPADAYRWAKGEVVAGDDGVPTRISKPLDFLMVSDHAEYMGLVPALAEGNEMLRATEEGGRWGRMIDEGLLTSEVFGEFILDATSNSPRLVEPEFEISVWNDIIDAAEAHNQPGVFTALIGYEYSPFPNGNNLHRVVVFRDGKERAEQVKPFSAFDSEDPEDLWEWLGAYENLTGGQILAISHNGNLSGGTMFALQTFQGNPLTREYAETRMRWEPLYEVTQYKGDSETHPYLSPEDQFADFETWDKANLAMLEPHEDAFFKYEYARSALMLGLGQESELGANPFKFGMIGATDSHTSFAQAAEDNFLGKYGSALPNPERWYHEWPPVPGVVATMQGWESASSGYAAVWATENTREAIWDAMKRKEVYATTGPRMVVRMFGGFDYTEADALSHDLVAIGYENGVPMGGDLSDAPAGASPTFLISASKDPDGANLDRVQVVKGWLSSDGELHEQIYDVAVSDGRRIVNGRATTDVGSTVDLATASYSNSIGDALLTTSWADPDFSPEVSSFYYVRVIEIPTPRWPVFDEVRFGIEMAPEVTRVLQERAYTSPIWYTPSN